MNMFPLTIAILCLLPSITCSVNVNASALGAVKTSEGSFCHKSHGREKSCQTSSWCFLLSSKKKRGKYRTGCVTDPNTHKNLHVWDLFENAKRKPVEIHDYICQEIDKNKIGDASTLPCKAISDIHGRVVYNLCCCKGSFCNNVAALRTEMVGNALIAYKKPERQRVAREEKSAKSVTPEVVDTSSTSTVAVEDAPELRVNDEANGEKEGDSNYIAVVIFVTIVVVVVVAAGVVLGLSMRKRATGDKRKYRFGGPTKHAKKHSEHDAEHDAVHTHTQHTVTPAVATPSVAATPTVTVVATTLTVPQTPQRSEKEEDEQQHNPASAKATVSDTDANASVKHGNEEASKKTSTTSNSRANTPTASTPRATTPGRGN